jgi:glycosyltransferase involved in cell wall biosynthesis
MSATPRKRVFYIYPPLFKYRAPFNVRIREILASHGVEYGVVYSEPSEQAKLRNDTIELPWADKVPISHIGPRSHQLLYQRALPVVSGADLVIMHQENKLLFNYLLHLRRFAGMERLAYFGHGRNFGQAVGNGFGERLKRFLATKVDWWFAYNDLSAKCIESYGFPAERITSVRNAIDMSELQQEVAATTREDLDARRRIRGLGAGPIAVYKGALKADKRIAFLIDAAIRIRRIVPGFELLVVGGGSELALVQKAAQDHPYIHALGPIYGPEMTELGLLADVLLMPGKVGLGVLDAFGYGKPLITTDFPFHAPEVDYLQDDVNGRVARPWQDADAYAASVAEVLTNDALRARLSRGAAAAASQYSIDNMAERFAGGVLQALKMQSPAANG